MTSLTEKLTAALAFDIVAASDQSRIKCHTMLRDMVSRGQAAQWGREMAELENARLAPLHLALVECAKELEKQASRAGIDFELNWLQCQLEMAAVLEKLAEVLK